MVTKFFTESIERKLLIPFFLLIIIAVLAIGVVSYWNAYDYYKNVQAEKLEDTISHINYQYNHLQELVKDEHLQKTVAQERLLQYIHDFFPEEVKIFSNESTLLNYVILENQQESAFGEVLVKEHELKDWGWTLHVSTIVSPFSNLFTNIEKYTIIVMVITSIALMELTMMLSSHLSKPIKKLAHFCERIDLGVEVQPFISSRRDEIGVLTNTINHMIQRLKKKEEDLFYMKYLNEQILESTSLGIYAVIHGERESVYMNQAAMDLLNKTNHSIMNTLSEIGEQVWKEKKDRHDILRLDDRVLEIKVNGIGKDLGTLCVFQDITEREKILREMEQIDRLTSLGELAAGMAHEIRNPLTGIKTSGQVLLRKFGEEPQIQGLIQRIIREIDRLDDLIKNLLQFARPASSNIKKVNLLSIINDVSFLLQKFLNQKKVQLSLSGIEKAIFVFDENHLKQIIFNLMLNAIKAINEGGKIEIKYEENKLIISDNGHGMAEEEIRRCFDPFYTTDPQGTGLGLAVVYRLVQQNKGNIQVYSKVNKGTTFIIEGGVE